MLNVKSVTHSYENVVFTVTITSLDGTVLWEAVTKNNKIIFGELNKFDIAVSIAGKIKFDLIDKKIF
jgi:hypothetical protein